MLHFHRGFPPTTEPAVTSTDKDCTKFRNGNAEGQVGGIYEYFDVPARRHEELMGASSKGRYFDRSIKNSYSYRQIR